MATSPERWARIKDVFDAAVAAPADRRQQLVDAAGLADDERAEVLSLLRHHEEATGGASGGGFLAAGATVPAPTGAARAGQRLGAWEVVRPLGAGGMGEVFEARRADGQYEGRAAVKLLKRGMDSAAVLQRFAQERQALARLNHPHIARLLDAGASDEGLPYFVMEYVEGLPIDEAARGRPLEDRLALFLQLADAVAYAHRNLLVHRDLKPGNVMVDGGGEVKLLDFGIAKALDPLEGADALATVGGVRPYTPHYASPEQVRGEPVTTATDLYSLGVLLYQMLTGLRPTGRKASTPAEAARGVLEEQPTRPSRLTAAEVSDPAWVQTRRRLEGDLDNILLKALEKAPERRYASAEGLAADLRAFLGGLPVSARAPTVGYVAGKFIRRHRAVAALAAALVLSLVAGIVAASWQAQQARQRLAGIKSITRDAVFRFGDAVTYVPGGMAIKADLLAQLAGVLDHLVQASGDDVDLRADAAQAYARLAEIESNDIGSALQRNESGRRHALRALELGREVRPYKLADAEFIVWYWRALATQARQQRAAGQPAQALQTLAEVPPMLDAAVERARQDGRAVDLLALRVERARVRHLQSQFFYKPGSPHLDRADDALATLKQARDELAELERAKHHPEILYLLGSVDGAEALVHEARDALEPALAAAERAMAARRAVVAELPRDVEYRDALITEAMTLGKVLTRLQRPRDALASTQLGWQTNADLEAEHPPGPDNAWSRRRPTLALVHGRALRGSGDARAALPVLEQAWPHVQRLEQDRHPGAAGMRAALEAELAQARADLAGAPRQAGGSPR